jgi:hypothetical protein
MSIGPADGTLCQGRLVGPICQVSWWDLVVGPAHGTGYQVHPSARGTYLPGRSVGGTRPWDPLSRSVGGTCLSGQLVGPGYQAEIF